jgi:hypothetical protein
MAEGEREVTAQVETGDPDGELVPLTRCLCGQTYEAWEQILAPYRDAPPMPCCGARLCAAVTVRVYHLQEAPAT